VRFRLRGDFLSQKRKPHCGEQLYEKYTQSGVLSMTMMARISKEMSGMNFHVTKEAAVFATEAHIHQMCTVANLVHSPCTPIWAPWIDTGTDYRLPFQGVVAHHLSDFQG
jgi:hypothetical protein